MQKYAGLFDGAAVTAWRGWRVQLAALMLLGAAAAASAAAPAACQITLYERAGIARANEYAVFGVPIPPGWQVNNATQFVLKNAAGTALSAQFEILARWGGASLNTAKPARWALVAYPVSIAAAGSESVYLHKAGTTPAPLAAISIVTTAVNRIMVDTGAAQFTLNTAAFNLFEQVTVSSQELLDTLGATAAIVYQQLNGTNVVPGGAPDLTARVARHAIERAGPLLAVIKLEGSIMHGAAAVLDYTARLHFYAGRADARLDFTVENNHEVLPDGMGQPVNARAKGLANSVYIGDLRLKIKPRNTGATLHVLAEQSVAVENPGSALRLFQESSGRDYWDAYTGTPGWPGQEELAHPRVQSYCTSRGFAVSGAGAALTGNQSEGWMAVYRAGGPRIMAAVRDFWQNYPMALEAATDGTLAIVLFPNGTQFHHNFRVGEEKTYSILFSFGTGALTHAQGSALAGAFNRPLFGAVEPAWYTNAIVLGEVPPASTNEWPLYEHYVRTAFTPNPDYDPSVDDPSFGNSTLQDRAIDGYDFYGWQDYGDVPLDYEAFDDHCAGQMNLKYWYTYGMFMQFCRSGDLRWLDLALPAARHVSDLDFQHIPDEGAWHWSHGAYYGHSQHDERGNVNPNRNFNSPSVDLVFGVPDLLLAYYLTGERRFQEVALEGLEGNLNMSEFSDFTDPIPSRERANLIFAYIEGLRETGDTRWLTQITNIVGQTANLSNKPWLTAPAAYGESHPGVAVKMFLVSQTLWTLGKYLDFCGEYGEADPFDVATALRAYCDFTINYATVSVGANASATVYEYFFDRSDESYVDHNNWTLVMADAMAYTYKYTGISNYLQAAARFYNTGVTDPQWSGDPPVYIDTKGLVNSLNWGLVYMNQTRSQPPDPGPGPGPDPGPTPTPGPSIKANGTAGALNIASGVPVNITVGMVAGGYAGIPADWWAVVVPDTGNWWCLNSAMQWIPFAAGNLAACQPAYQGDVMDLTDFSILNQYTLPTGRYAFYFALDHQDGILNYPEILSAMVTVTVAE